MNYTEENQKAEFIGGAIAGGCGLIVMFFIAVLVIGAIIVSITG